MATFDYAKSQATAHRLLTKFGQAGLIRRQLAGNGSAHNPGIGQIVDYPCTLTVMQYSSQDIDGTLIKSSDKKVYVSAKGLTVAPTTTDHMVIGGVASVIVSVKQLNPAGIVVYWECQCRA